MNRLALEAERVRMMAGRSSPLLFASIHVAIHELGVVEKTAWDGVEGKPIMQRRLGCEVGQKASRQKITEQKLAKA